jgi:hypothetical protein
MAVVVPRARVLPAFFLIAALAYPLVFHRLGDRELSSSHEARAAQDAQAMLLDRRWDLPQLFDRKVELQKPPLYYWLVAGVALARGRPVDGWAVRLPAALAGLGCALLLALLGGRRGRPIAGACAGLMLLTALHFTWLARVGRIDLPLAFTTGLALTGFFLGRQQDDGVPGSRLWLLVGYVAAATRRVAQRSDRRDPPRCCRGCFSANGKAVAAAVAPTCQLGPRPTARSSMGAAGTGGHQLAVVSLGGCPDRRPARRGLFLEA